MLYVRQDRFDIDDGDADDAGRFVRRMIERRKKRRRTGSCREREGGERQEKRMPCSDVI